MAGACKANSAEPAMTLPGHISQGQGDTAVFLLHGVGGAKEAWLVTMAALASAGMRAVAWDMPGYGTSATLSPYTLRGLALALESLIDHIGARRNVPPMLWPSSTLRRAPMLSISDSSARARPCKV